MKIKNWLKGGTAKFLLILLTGSIVASPVFAAVNGSISISGSGGTYNVTDHSGGIIIPNPEGTAATNFLFFTSRPSPVVTTSGLTPVAYSKYAAAGGFDVHRYDFSGTGNVYVLALSADNTHYAIISTGSYYTGSWLSSSLALSGTEAKDYFIAGQTTYLKDTPYAPSSIGVTESQVRVGDSEDTQTTLDIVVTPNNGSSPNYCEIGGSSTGNYALQIVKEGDTGTVTTVMSGTPLTGPSLINQSSGTFTATGEYFQAGETYTLTAWNRNWFTSDDSATKKLTTSWTLLGASAYAVPQVFTLEVKSLVDDGTGAGINFFSMPFAAPWYVYKSGGTTYVGSIESAYDVVLVLRAIDASAKASHFSTWDNSGQMLEKVIIPSTLDSATEAALRAIPLEQGHGYQVYVPKDVTLVIKNTAPSL
jgi:hypothetical protein